MNLPKNRCNKISEFLNLLENRSNKTKIFNLPQTYKERVGFSKCLTVRTSQPPDEEISSPFITTHSLIVLYPTILSLSLKKTGQITYIDLNYTLETL
ncbi:unnamed protein product [Rhizophagus irregularis]|nr:unnamed protein product [Rhizophagus irregularis]